MTLVKTDLICSSECVSCLPLVKYGRLMDSAKVTAQNLALSYVATCRPQKVGNLFYPKNAGPVLDNDPQTPSKRADGYC